jgi:exonuclease III
MKLYVVDDSIIYDMIGSGFTYEYVPAIGTCGGILLAWRLDLWNCTRAFASDLVLMVRVMHARMSTPWWLATVYGPQSEQVKVQFLQELQLCMIAHIDPWLLCGDFNLVHRAKDKNNGRLNHQMMGRFCKFMQDLELIELHLHGHLYTWSNKQDHPTLEHIDRVFACVQWCDQFPHHHLGVFSSACSNHSPLLLHTNITHTPTRDSCSRLFGLNSLATLMR